MSENKLLVEEMFRYRDACEVLDGAIRAALGPGTRIAWDHHGYRQTGNVIKLGLLRQDDTSIKVRNDRTGRAVWIGLYQVAGFPA